MDVLGWSDGRDIKMHGQDQWQLDRKKQGHPLKNATSLQKSEGMSQRDMHLQLPSSTYFSHPCPVLCSHRRFVDFASQSTEPAKLQLLHHLFSSRFRVFMINLVFFESTDGTPVHALSCPCCLHFGRCFPLC